MDIGLAISAVEYAIQVAHKVRDTARSLNQNPKEYNALLTRFRSIRKTLNYVRVAGNLDLSSPVWGSAFLRIHNHFEDAASELSKIHEELQANPFVKFFITQNTTERLQALEDDVDQLQRDLDMLGFFTLSNAAAEAHSKHALHNLQNIQNSIAMMEGRLNSMSNSNLESSHGKKHSKKKKKSHHRSHTKSRGLEKDIELISNDSGTSLSSVDTLSPSFEGSNIEERDISDQKTLVNQVQDLEVSLQNSFSKILQSNLSDDDKDLVCDRILAMWKRWRIDPRDVVITRPTKGTDQSRCPNCDEPVTFGGKLSVRDHEGRVVRVANIVIRMLFTDLDGEGALDRLVRKVLLLRELNHPCTVYYYGGYWKTDSCSTSNVSTISTVKSKEEDGVLRTDCSFVISEQMTDSLCNAINHAALENKNIRINIIRDIARGGKYIHAKGVFNLNLQPKYIWLRIVEGCLVGTAKIGNLEPACEAKVSDEFSSQQDNANNDAKILQEENHVTDVWHFGVIACLLLSTKASEEGLNLSKLIISPDDNKITNELPSLIEAIEEPELKELIGTCTSSDPKIRPEFKEIYDQVQSFLSRANSNDPSQVELGRNFRVQAKDFFFGKNGKDLNLEKAVELYQKAADHGDTAALVNLGDCNYYGLGTTKDINKAIDFYHEAAHKNNKAGLVRLADCYHKGIEVTKDLNFAMNLYRRAAANGNASAQYKLGCYLLNENVGDLNSAEEAASLFQKAADAGHRFAEFYLGMCFEEGHGVRKDIKSAISWYGRSASHGHVGAQWALKRLEQIEI